jgi:hypothetical protein
MNSQQFLSGLLILCLCVTPGCTRTEVKSGTVVVMAYSQNHVVLEADSRQFNGTTGTYEDSACKLSAFGDKFLFGESGFAGYDGWSGAYLARKIVSALSSDSPPNITQTISIAWGNSMQEHLRLVPQNVLNASKVGPEGELGMAFFVGIENENIEVRIVTIHTPDRSGFNIKAVKPSMRETAFLAIGKNEIFGEFAVHPISQRAIAEIRKWNLSKLSPGEFDQFKAKRLVELTIKLAKPEDIPFLGGDVDMVEIIRD